VITISAPITSTTALAGDANAFSSVSDALSSELSAAIAASMIGTAAAMSRSHTSLNSVTSVAIAEHFSSSAREDSFCSSATAVSLPMSTISASVATFFSSTTACSRMRFSFSASTIDDDARSLSSPFSRRP
jgi:hypothetical protein